MILDYGIAMISGYRRDFTTFRENGHGDKALFTGSVTMDVTLGLM